MITLTLCGIALPLYLIISQAAPDYADTWRTTENMLTSRGLPNRPTPLTIIMVETIRRHRRNS